jgi:heme O synthase-like polyprenyltransferase
MTTHQNTQKIVGYVVIVIIALMPFISNTYDLLFFTIDKSAFDSGHTSLSWDQQEASNLFKYFWCFIYSFCYLTSIIIVYFTFCFTKFKNIK